MPKKMIISLIVCLLAIWQPIIVQAADKNVSDCLNDNEDCNEKIDKTEENESETSEQKIDDENMDTGSFALNIVKMILALLLILAMIYAMLWFLKKRRKYDQVGALENIGGISVGQNKSVQIVRIGSKMYLLGIGDNVELLQELSEEEAQEVKNGLEQVPTAPAATFLQNVLKKRGLKKNQRSENDDGNFNASFQKELDKMKENRHQMMDSHEKDDGHV